MRLTQTQRVEMALPARFMLTIVLGLLTPENDEEKATVETVKALLVRATGEPLQGFNAATRAFVWKKVETVHEKAALALMMRDPVKDGMVLYYFLETYLLKTGFLELQEGSAFAEAMRLVLPYLESFFAEALLDASAQKQARHLLELLQAEGYYRDVPEIPSLS